MGIQGLLPVLRSLTVPTHLRELRGQTCAVDVYAWIHRGTYACATELCLEGSSEGYVSFCLSMLDLLLSHSITPIMVFDGARLMAKEDVERGREVKRANGLQEGKRLMALGKSKEAVNAFVKAVDVTPEMARNVVLAFRKRNVQVIVAPFEADAQLAFLSHQSKVDFIVSEDSDLLAFGSKKVLFKLDRTGSGQLIDSRRLRLAEEIYLEHFNSEMFLDMCILAGCDYLDSVTGVGMKTAHQLVQKYKVTERILRGLRFECKGQIVPIDYERRFYQAKLTFRHQVVFCQDTKRFVHLTSLPEALSDVQPYKLFNTFDFLGRIIVEPHVHDDWAKGDINVATLERFPGEPTEVTIPMVLKDQHRTNNTTLKNHFKPGGAAAGTQKALLPKCKTLDSFFSKKPPSLSTTTQGSVSSERNLSKSARLVSTGSVATTNPWMIRKSTTSSSIGAFQPLAEVSKSRFFVPKLSRVPSASSSSLLPSGIVDLTSTTVDSSTRSNTTSFSSHSLIEGACTGLPKEMQPVVSMIKEDNDKLVENFPSSPSTCLHEEPTIREDYTFATMSTTIVEKAQETQSESVEPGVMSKSKLTAYDDVEGDEDKEDDSMNTGSTQASTDSAASKRPRLMIGLSRVGSSSSVSSVRTIAPKSASSFEKYAYRG